MGIKTKKGRSTASAGSPEDEKIFATPPDSPGWGLVSTTSVPPKTSRARGYIEAVEKGVLRGWFINSAKPSDDEAIVEINGVVAGRVKANSYRDDLAAAKIGEGRHGFSFVVPDKWRDGKTHRFALKLASKNSAEPFLAATLASSGERYSLSGLIERVADGVVHGWASDLFQPDKRLTITIKRNGAVVGSGIANREREDLRAAGIGDGRYGFAIALEAEALSASPGSPREFIAVADGSYDGAVIGKVSLEAPAEAGRQAAGSVNGEVAGGAVLPEAALKKLRTVPNSAFYLNAKHRSDQDECRLGARKDEIRIQLDQPKGWIRLMHSLPSLQELLASDTAIRLSFLASAPFRFSVNIMDWHDSGQFRVVHRISKECFASAGENEFEFRVKARRLRSEWLDQIPRPLFIVFETSSAFTFAALQLDLKAIPEEEERIPYRRSDQPLSVQLAQINDALASYGKRNTNKWTLDMAEAAVRLECFETASALLRRVQVDQTHDEATRRQYLATFAEVAFAEGRIDDLRARLLEHKALVLKDDGLFSSLSMCFPQTEAMADFFGILPSGHANRSFLSKCDLGSATLRAMLSPQREHDDGQTDLLMASKFKSLGPDNYVRYWNTYLSRFGLAKISSVDLSKPNILTTIKFEASPQRDDGDKVSVIMSAYNAADTIAYAAHSILEQTYRNVELLICDDGSSDTTQAVLKPLAKNPRIRVFKSVKNQGTYNIRNALMEQARGRFITFQDSDDYAHPERIARQVDALKASSAKAAIGRWVRVRPNGDVVFFRDHRCLRLSVVSLMAERTAFSQLGDYRKVMCAGDSELYEQLRMLGGRVPFATLEMPLIFGLWSSRSMTQQSGLEATEDGFRSLARRRYAEISTRHRLLGAEIVPSEDVDAVNRESGIYRTDHGIKKV